MSAGEEFVTAWTEAWRDPIRQFVQLFHPEGTLLQQGMGKPIPRDQIPAHTGRVLALIPDVRIKPVHWAANGEVVLIEWSASGTFRDRKVQWGGASRFTLCDGLILEEIAYWDTLTLRALIDPSLKQGDLVAAAMSAGEGEVGA